MAYDFDLFAPKTAGRSKSRDNLVVKPDRDAKTRTRSAAKIVSAPAMLIMTAVIVLAGLCGNIALRLKINEVNSQINDVRTQIAEVDSEKTELQMEMQRRISYSNLELEAVQLGMKKPEKENVVFIRVNDKNAAQTADGTFIVSE